MFYYSKMMNKRWMDEKVYNSPACLVQVGKVFLCRGGASQTPHILLHSLTSCCQGPSHWFSPAHWFQVELLPCIQPFSTGPGDETQAWVPLGIHDKKQATSPLYIKGGTSCVPSLGESGRWSFRPISVGLNSQISSEKGWMILPSWRKSPVLSWVYLRQKSWRQKGTGHLPAERVYGNLVFSVTQVGVIWGLTRLEKWNGFSVQWSSLCTHTVPN